MTRTQRWTLAVVCAATAMLMLDIAVVNTALSAIAADLDTGLSGLQWVIDAYTLPLAATVLTAGALADRFGRRRLFVHRPRRLHRHLAAVRGGAVDHDAQRRAGRAGRRRRGDVRGLAGRALQRVPAHGGAHQGARRLRRDDGRLVRGRAAGRRRAHLRPRLALDLPHQPAARAAVPVDRAPASSPSRWTRARRASTGRASSRSPVACSCSSSRCCAATRSGWGSAPIVASFAGAAALLCAFVAIEARVAQPMLPLRLFRNPSFTGAQVGGVRDLRVAVRDVALHDALPAADPRAVGDRGRPGLRARARC